MASISGKKIVVKTVSGAVAALLALHALLMFGLLGVNEIPWIAAGLFLLFIWLRPLNGLLLSGAFLVVAVVLAVFVEATYVDDSLYFKPTAKILSYDFKHGYQVFEPNRSLEMVELFGDLKAKTTSDVEHQRKTVRFVTDSNGFRNEQDYSGEPYLLLGDSFIVCTSVTQDEILSKRLSEHGLDVYNLAAVGGDLTDYVRWSQVFYDEHREEPKILLFFFEGNDFFSVSEGDAARPGFIERYRDLYRFMPLGKYVFTQFNRFRKSSNADGVISRRVAGRQMLFYERYVEVCRRDRYEGGPDFVSLLAGLADRVAVVYFIPAKYRIYGPLAEEGPERGLPNAQWEFLKRTCDGLGLACVDLTPALAARSKELLPDEFTYYLDDTHWNSIGITTAANVIKATLSGPGGPAD